MTVTAEPDRAERPRLSDEELKGLLRAMIAARHSSTRCFAMQRQGRLGTMAPLDGAEAAVVGAAAALDPERDWILPQYREFHGLERFGEQILPRFVRYLRGDPSGGHLPEPIRVWPPQISLAAQIPQAAGMAWGMRVRGEPGVTLCFFGDGASSEGDFYEGCNLAGVLELPVIFFCINNSWAISTPVHWQTASRSFAAKAAAFGFPGEKVDGCDVLAVHEAVARARARAAAGDGPTLIEATAYRLGPHTTADDPGRYVPEEELAAARERDPIVAFRAQLEERGLWDGEDEAAADAAARERMDRAVADAESSKLAPDSFFDHVFATPTPRMERQRRRLLEHLRRREG